VSYIGNRFTIGTITEHVRAGKLPEGVSYRFTSPKTAALKEVYWCKGWGTEGGAPELQPKYNVSIRPDTRGIPSSTVLDQVNLGGGSLGEGYGWDKVVFPNSPLLEAGKIYHVVAYVTEWTNLTLHPRIVMFGVRLGGYFGAPDQPFVIPRSQVIDEGLRGAFYDRGIHKAWVPVAHTPIFVLHFADGSYHGQPYKEYRQYDLGYYVSVGQEFTPKRDVTVNSAFVHGRTAWSTPADKLYGSLFDKAAAGYLARNIVMTTPKIKSWGWCRAGFPAPITLRSGRTYRLEIKSPLSSPSVSYEIKVVGAVIGGGNVTPGPEARETIYENGAVFSRDGGVTWSKEPYFTVGYWDMPYFIT